MIEAVWFCVHDCVTKLVAIGFTQEKFCFKK